MNQRILVIDFEPRALGALKELLEGAGYQVRTAGSGQDIVAALKEWAPALVVVEPMIPGQDGFKLCQGLKRGKFGVVPIVVVASRIYRGNRFRDMAMEAGADIFLERPQNDPILLSSIQKLLPPVAEPPPLVSAPSPIEAEPTQVSDTESAFPALKPTTPPTAPVPPKPVPAPLAATPHPPAPRPSMPAPTPAGTPNVFARLSDGDIEEALCRALGPPTDSEPTLSRTGPLATSSEGPTTPPVRVYTSQTAPPPVTSQSVSAPRPAVTSPELPADFFGSDPSLDSILDRVFPIASSPEPQPAPPAVVAPPTPTPSSPPSVSVSAAPGPSPTGMFALDETFNGRPSLPTEASEPACSFELVTVHEETKPLPPSAPLNPEKKSHAKPEDGPAKEREEWQPSDAALGTEPEDGGPPPSGPVAEPHPAELGKRPSGEDLETALDNVFARITGTVSPEVLAGLATSSATGASSTGASAALREVPEKLRGMDAGTADLLSSLEELENSIPEGVPTSDIRGDSVWTGSTGFEATGLSREMTGSIPLHPPPTPEDERTLEEVFARLLDEDKEEGKLPPRPEEPQQVQPVALTPSAESAPEVEPSSTGKKRPFWANWFGLGAIGILVVFGAVYRLLPSSPPDQTPAVAADTIARTIEKKPGRARGTSAPVPPPRVLQSAKNKPKTKEKKLLAADSLAPDLPLRTPPVPASQKITPTPPESDSARAKKTPGSFRPTPETASAQETEFGADEPIPVSMTGPPLARSNELDSPLRLVSGKLPQAPPGTVVPGGGRVVLNVLIGPDGTVRETRVMFDPGGGIAELARKTVMNWRYSGPVRGGEPVQVWKTEVLEVAATQ